MKQSFITIIVFALSLAYAVIRYNVYGGVYIDNLPLFVVNKSIAMTALFCLGMSVVLGAAQTKRWFGKVSLSIALGHIIISLIILSPDYFPKLYLDAKVPGRLTLLSESALLAGAVALLLTLWLATHRGLFSTVAGRRIGHLISCSLVLAVALHCALLGWSGWFSPTKWPGYMPPITLISAIFAAAAGGIGLLKAWRAEPPPDCRQLDP